MCSPAISTACLNSSRTALLQTFGAGAHDNIKAAEITIYAIQIHTDNEQTSTILQYCASGMADSFILTSSSRIITTLQQIGTDLSQLRR
jgi:hypothetical protein